MDSEWTDKRMNDFVGRVGRFEGDVKERFNRVDREFDKVDLRFDRFEGDVKKSFAKVDARFDKVEAELGGKIDRMTRVLVGGLVTVVGSVIIKVFLG